MVSAGIWVSSISGVVGMKHDADICYGTTEVPHDFEQFIDKSFRRHLDTTPVPDLPFDALPESRARNTQEPNRSAKRQQAVV